MTRSFFSRFTVIPSAIAVRRRPRQSSLLSRLACRSRLPRVFGQRNTRSRGGGGASSSIAASPKAAIFIFGFDGGAAPRTCWLPDMAYSCVRVSIDGAIYALLLEKYAALKSQRRTYRRCACMATACKAQTLATTLHRPYKTFVPKIGTLRAGGAASGLDTRQPKPSHCNTVKARDACLLANAEIRAQLPKSIRWPAAQSARSCTGVQHLLQAKATALRARPATMRRATPRGPRRARAQSTVKHTSNIPSPTPSRLIALAVLASRKYHQASSRPTP